MTALGLAVAILVAAGCALPGTLATGTPVGCPLNLIEGTLAGTLPDTLALVTDDGQALEIDWSDSFVVRAGTPIELVDPDGGVVARAGDRVVIFGAATRGSSGSWSECGGLRVKVRGS